MLVAHVVLSLDVGGLERVVLDLVREGPALGIASVIVCIERPGELAGTAELLGVPVVCLDKPPGLRLRTRSRLSSLFRELSPDVVHSHQVGALFYAGSAARRAGIPVVVHTEHGKHPYQSRWRKRLLAKASARRADRFFCVSDDIAQAIQKCGIAAASRIAVVRNGIRTSEYVRCEPAETLRLSLAIPAGAPVIGTVGRLNEVKRQDILIRAFGAVRTSLPDAHLLLVGDGPARLELENLVDELGLRESVHFVGYQPEPRRYLHLMDVFVISSRSEGMPLSVLEAWAAGVPVVASRVGGLPELINDQKNGVLVDFDDIGALQDGIRKIVIDQSFRERLRDAAQSHVLTHFDVRQMTRDYHDQYVSLLRDITPSKPPVEEPI